MKESLMWLSIGMYNQSILSKTVCMWRIGEKISGEKRNEANQRSQ